MRGTLYVIKMHESKISLASSGEIGPGVLSTMCIGECWSSMKRHTARNQFRIHKFEGVPYEYTGMSEH